MFKKALSLIGISAVVLMNISFGAFAIVPAGTTIGVTAPTSVFVGDPLEFVVQTTFPNLSTVDASILGDTLIETSFPSSVSIAASKSSTGASGSYIPIGSPFSTNTNFWVKDFTGTRAVLNTYSNQTVFYKFTISSVPANWDLADISVTAKAVAGTATQFGTADQEIFATSSPKTIGVGIRITSFDSDVNPFEPINSTNGQSEAVTFSYVLNSVADTIKFEIFDKNNETLKTLTATNLASGTFVWDGKNTGRFVPPGTSYKAKLTATKGTASKISEKPFSVVYNHAEKPVIENATASVSSFDPDTADVTFKFRSVKDFTAATSFIEIRNSSKELVNTLSPLTPVSGEANSYSTIWDGENSSNNSLPIGAYTADIIIRNDFGTAMTSLTVSLNNDGGSSSSSNAHIGDISFEPSSTFEPAEDDELEIEYDVKVHLDELKIVAVRGQSEIEIDSLTDIDEENNLISPWDGTDKDNDDEYADPGEWRIEFRSKVGTTTLTAVKDLTVEYNKPLIDDLQISKKDFDPDQDEFTFIMFAVDEDANVDIKVLESGQEDDDIEEDFEVEKDQWYAVEWDGGSYDENDDVEIKVIAKNKVNDNVFDSEKIAVDLKEDSVSSSKSNVTNDYISPAANDWGQSFSLFYTLEDDADVEVTIHKGTTGTGSEMIKLLDITDQKSGDHEIEWDGKDDDGDYLAKGLYTYKIVSKKSSTETEKGVFVIEKVGDISGDSGSDNSSDNDGGGSVAPGVIIDGGSGGDSSNDDGENCAGYSDVDSDSKYCTAIEWAKDEGIFTGYSDGTFKPNQTINRAEVLKVVLEAMNISLTGELAVPFLDAIPGSWYMPYLATARGYGIFHGDSGRNTARPSDPVNRAEALKFAFETLRTANGYIVSGCQNPYGDVSSNSWYTSYVCGAKQYDLFDVSGALFAPSSAATRGDTALMLYRMDLAGLL